MAAVSQLAGGSSPQLLLDPGGIRGQPYQVYLAPNDRAIWHQSLMIPAGIAGVSAIILLLQLAIRLRETLRFKAATTEQTTSNIMSSIVDIEQPRVKKHIDSLGGFVIFSFRFARLLCCLALLGLSSMTVIKANAQLVLRSSDHWTVLSLCGVYGYTVLLSLASILAGQYLSRLACRHLATVLALTWIVYVYRDIWPLATFTLSPLDAAEGWRFWVKFGILSAAGTVIPLTSPRQYIPVDPKDPKEPTPEQTASLLSLMLYFHLDPLIMKAYRTSHLKLEELPPVADYDMAEYWIHNSFSHLDPFQMKKQRNLFWGILIVFWKEWLFLSAMLLISVFTMLASPVSMNRLLRYVETGGQDAVVRPWVWIFWLFFGPAFGSVVFQGYFFIGMKVTRRVQAILISLIFNHSLRIRVKSEEDIAPGESSRPSTSITPDTASVAESTEGGLASSESVSDEHTVDARVGHVDSDAKDKQKAKIKTDALQKDTPPPTPSAGAKSNNLAGRLNNLMTVDMDRIANAREWLSLVLLPPVQVTFSVWFLYELLGWSSLVGLASMIALFPVPGYFASLTQSLQKEKMKKTDTRVQAVTDTVNVIRMIKLFGWEPRMMEQIAQKRKEELEIQRRFQILNFSITIGNFIIPLFTLLVTLFTYSVVMKQELTASKLFSSIAVFDLLRMSLSGVTTFLPICIQGKVSLDRVQDYLRNTELLDQFSAMQKTGSGMTLSEAPHEGIGIREASFTWTNETDNSGAPGSLRRRFTLRIEDELTFKRGQINLIVGPTGSGKTSLLMALLGEMHYIPSGPNSYVSLPRDGGVAYAAQESWVQNETIKDNIVFSSPYDEERYKKVISQCALERDLKLFDAGDLTEVGEKGITLSGGQKARITLARAIYSPAEVLLLDDILAALDVHTSKWIVEKCLTGDLVRGRTVILVTHNVALAGPIADIVISFGSDGRIASQGTLDMALTKSARLLKQLKTEAEEVDKAEHEVELTEPAIRAAPKDKSGKLVVEEEIAVGRVGWPAFKMYLQGLGGSHPVLFWAASVGGLFVINMMFAVQVWFLGFWASQYEDHDPKDVHVGFYLGGYSVMLLVLTLSFSLTWIVWVFGGIRASRKLHHELIASVLRTTLRWLDKTPVSRIIARCTQDIDEVDGGVTRSAFWLIDGTLDILIRLFAIIAYSPIFSIPGAVLAVVGGWCGQMYLKAQLCVKREMSNAKAPVLTHLGAAVVGLISIRAYGVQDILKEESIRRVNRLTQATTNFYDLTRWISLRLDVLGGLFTSGLAAYLVYVANVQASNIGFSLNMAVGFANLILFWVRNANNLEVSANSLERVQQYLEIEHEPKPTPEGVPPAYWPASGDLKVDRLSARYSEDGPRVLHDISFEVKSGERVGIVGRTGSGKSSLMLALLRAIITEGNVYYDGIQTDTVNLDALRSNITIIPQVPELLSGTLRQNLDPFGQYDDAVLNDALRAAGLSSLQSQDDEGRITLDSEIASGGSNLSVGQRQILALARTMVRQSKILILDEATSAIDYATDTVIQRSLRNELGRDVTLLIVAHRLQTIMDADKILVLDAGRIVEFGTPRTLLQNPQGSLHALVEESGEKDLLYQMAEGASSL